MNLFGIIVRIPASITKRLPPLWAVVVVLLLVGVGAGDRPAVAQTYCPFSTAQFILYKNSPATEVSYVAFGDESDGTKETVNFSSGQSYTSITNVTTPPLHYVTLRINTNGLPSGNYCARIPWSGTFANGSVTSYNDIGIILIGGGGGGVFFMDPVPDLVSGNATKTDSQLQTLISLGNVVQGVAADGVTQLLIRIDAGSTASGHQFAVTLTDDQGLSGSNILPGEDGALGLPGGTIFSSGQVIVTSGNPDANGLSHAFAVYRAPVDFARPTGTGFKSGVCQGRTMTDDQLACRSVSIQVQDLTANSNLGTFPLTIIRPMVTAIHGLWSNWRAWDKFSPLVNGVGSVDQRFFVHRANYDFPVAITASTPTYPSKQLQTASANSLGFQFNAAVMLTQMNTELRKFKNRQNPLLIPVAAVQADVAAHSLGGDIARTMASLTKFLSDPNNPTFGQGNIHKLITIDTPHLGSSLAGLLLDTHNACTASYLASNSDFSFTSVTLSGSANPVPGAIGDLTPGSKALSDNANGPITHLLPTALIVGVYTNFAALDSAVAPGWIRHKCPTDPLAASLTSSGWSGNFGNAQNDAVVDVNSQLNGLSASAGIQFTGYVHSVGVEALGFARPSVLDPDIVAPQTISIPNQLIKLLNTPYTNQTFFMPLNP